MDMSAMLTNVTSAVQDLSLQHSHTEDKIGDICHAHNDLIGACNDYAKLADLEDRSRCNKIKFREIPKTVTQPLLYDFLHQLLSKLMPSVTETELLIDRLYRIPKPSYLTHSLLHQQKKCWWLVPIQFSQKNLKECRSLSCYP